MANYMCLEFQDDCCRVYLWAQSRSACTLKAALTVPFQRGDVAAAGEAPEASLAVPAPGESLGAQDETFWQRENGQALRKALKDAGLKVEEALAVVPKHWVTLRVVTLPATDPDELNEMARFEAERHIPFNVERHIIAHRVLAKGDLEGSRVLIAAIDGPPIEQVTGTCLAAGLRVTGVEVSTVALVNVLRHSGQWDPAECSTVAFVNVGPANTDILVLHEGEPIFARSMAMGAQRIRESLAEARLAEAHAAHPAHAAVLDLDEDDGMEGAESYSPVPESGSALASGGVQASLFAPDAAPGGTDAVSPTPPAAPVSQARFDVGLLRSNRLIREIRRTLDYANREFDCGNNFGRVFLSGQGVAVPDLAEVFQLMFQTQVTCLDPFAESQNAASAFRLRCEPSVLAQEPTGAAFALAAGALVREADPESLRIDLVPPAYVEEHAKSRRKQRIIYFAFAMFLALTAGFITAKKVLDDKKSQLAQLEVEIADIKERVNEIKRKQMVVGILRDYTSLDRSPLAILDRISQWTDFFAADHPRVCLTSFEYQREKVTLEGWTQTYPDLDAFEANLMKAGLFEEVSAKRDMASPPNTREQAVKFTLTCIFKTQAQEKKK